MEIVYSVPGMSCGHCKSAVESELFGTAGVEEVEVDLDTKLVTVRGSVLSDAELRAAIGDAGYDVTS